MSKIELMEDFRLIKIKPTHMIHKEIKEKFIKMIINFNPKIQIIKGIISVLKLMKKLIKNTKKNITSTREEIDLEMAGMIGRMPKPRKIITVN